MLSKIDANKLVVSVGVLIFTLVLLVNQGEAFHCGKQVDFKEKCSEGYCCSKWGWCGKGDAYCGPDNCQSQCPPPPSPPPPPPPNPHQCGKQVDFKKNCSEGYCCSNWGFCGTTDWYCGPDYCQSQCPPPSPSPSPPPPAPAPLPPNPIKDILTKELFEEMLMFRNDVRCPAHGFYSYDAFITAASTYPEFGNTGDLETRKRELAAFFGQTSHETTGGWADAPGGPYAWGYCFKAEVGATNDYCVSSNEWPCVPGKKYYGRGPIQLSYNYNYGQAGAALDLPLLNDPDLVENDPLISFETALWFWMTPQPPKPSAHDVITGKWKPTQEDIAAGRVPGYGVITNIINGGLECGIPGPDPRVEDRIGFYKRYCDILGVSYGENLDCYDQCPFTGCRGLMGVFSF